MNTTVPHYELFRRGSFDLRLPEQRGKVLVVDTYEPMDADRARELLKDHFERVDELEDAEVRYVSAQRAFPGKFLKGQPVYVGSHLPRGPGNRIDLADQFLWPRWEREKKPQRLVVRIHGEKCYVVNQTRQSIPINPGEERLVPLVLAPGKTKQLKEGWVLQWPHPDARGVVHHLTWLGIPEFHRLAIEEDTSHMLDEDQEKHPEWDGLRGEAARRVVREKFQEAKLFYPLQSAAKLVVPK